MGAWLHCELPGHRVSMTAFPALHRFQAVLLFHGQIWEARQACLVEEVEGLGNEGRPVAAGRQHGGQQRAHGRQPDPLNGAGGRRARSGRPLAAHCSRGRLVRHGCIQLRSRFQPEDCPSHLYTQGL